MVDGRGHREDVFLAKHHVCDADRDLFDGLWLDGRFDGRILRIDGRMMCFDGRMKCNDGRITRLDRRKTLCDGRVMMYPW